MYTSRDDEWAASYDVLWRYRWLTQAPQPILGWVYGLNPARFWGPSCTVDEGWQVTDWSTVQSTVTTRNSCLTSALLLSALSFECSVEEQYPHLRTQYTTAVQGWSRTERPVLLYSLLLERVPIVAWRLRTNNNDDAVGVRAHMCSTQAASEWGEVCRNPAPSTKTIHRDDGFLHCGMRP